MRVNTLQKQILSDLRKQPTFIRGQDKDGRALLCVRARISKGTVGEDFIAMMMYTMERAIAVTEVGSRGLEEKLLVVLDFGSFSSSLAPPLSAIKELAAILQSRYTERLKTLIIIDPPFWMRTMYNLIGPFLDPVTKAKFSVVSGAKQKEEIVSQYVSRCHAMPWLLPNGELKSEVDLDHYVTHVAFHEGF